MPSWNHSICESCWRYREGINRMPVRVNTGTAHQCCFCGLPTNGGIFVRENPNNPRLHCREHEDYHEELYTRDDSRG